MPSRLAEHLVARGLLSPQQAADALRALTTPGTWLDDWLLSQRALPEASLLHALAEVNGHKAVHLPDYEPNRDMAALLAPRLAEKLSAVPLSVEPGALHVASAYPVATAQLAEVGTLLGKKLVLWSAPHIRIREWMSLLYGTLLKPAERELLSLMNDGLARPESQAIPVRPPSSTSMPQVVTQPPQAEPPRAAPRPPPPVAPVTTPRAPVSAPPAPRVEPTEDFTLEETLTREMVEQLAERILLEPIPLETRKGRRAEPAALPGPPRPPSVTPIAPAAEGASNPDLNAAVDLAAARTQLQTAAPTREAVMEVVLRFALQTFEFAAAFAVIRGVAAGWAARGERAETLKIASLSIPLDAASIFRTVALTRSSYVGPVPADSLSRELLQSLGRAPRTLFLQPVEVKGRLVAILYGDGGSRPLSQRRLSDFALFCRQLPAAFERLILARRAAPVNGETTAPPDEQLTTPPPSRPWSPSTPSLPSGAAGRTAASATRTQSEGERPPPDFDPLLRRLLGPDAAQRARTMAELARAPEASARVLCQNFPGPTAWGIATVAELPEADELGPLPGALSRLGRPAAQHLAPLLDADDSTQRYFALLTAGSLPYAELVPGLLRGLFDLTPEVSSAARAASVSFRKLPRFELSLRHIRQDLTSIDPLRRSLAARALGALHDRDAIEGLIGLTASDDALCAQSAAQALTDITFAPLGLDTRGWSRWWAENRERPRSEWLLAALRSPHLEQRTGALDELMRYTQDPFGFQPDGPPAQRELAVQKWQLALVQDARLRWLD